MNKTKLSLAALLAGASMVAAEDIPVVNVGGTNISLYGYLQLNAVYEDGASEKQGNHYSRWANPEADKADGHFWMNPNSTRLGFNFSGPQKEGKPEVGGKLETDFNDGNPERKNNGAFRIRHAYGQIKFKDLGLTLLMGQSSDLIAPLGAPTINQAGLESAGKLGTRRPQIRITETVSFIEAAVAVTNDRTNADLNAVAPAFQGSLGAKMPASWAGEKQNVQIVFSGHYAFNETSGNSKSDVDLKDTAELKYPTSWSGVASLSVPVINLLKFSGEVFYGQELKRYNSGSISQSNLSGTLGQSELSGIQSMGGWGAWEFKLGDVGVAGGMGLEAIDDDRCGALDKDGKRVAKNRIIFGNVKYNIAETLWVGFEYSNIATEYKDKDGKGFKNKDDKSVDGKLNRFELGLNYAFK
jgi:hypothetical protein